MQNIYRGYISLAVLAIFAAVVLASVFAYYPIQATVAPASPPVVFAPGSNANKADLGAGNTISVSTGANATSLAITVHPTYQATYYKSVALIQNKDTQAYYITLKVANPLSLPQGSKAVLYVYSANTGRSLSGFPASNLAPATGSYVASLDLLTTAQTGQITVGAGASLEVDILVYLPEGVALPSPSTANIYMVVSPTNEVPP